MAGALGRQEAVLGDFPDEPARTLAGVCAALQAHAGDGPFYLSYRTAQAVCGFGNHVTAGDRLKRFVADGRLELVERGIPGAGRRRASRYRWRGTGEETSP